MLLNSPSQKIHWVKFGSTWPTNRRNFAKHNPIFMARLQVKTEGLQLRSIELRLGANRVGRDPDADFTLTHPSVSFTHCEFILSNDGVFVHDCDSTNGTFVNGELVKAAHLKSGQAVRLGDVELMVESTEVIIAIPKIEREMPVPPPVQADGSLLCRRHPESPVTFRCTHCLEQMCTACLHILRLQGGGKPLYLCPLCSHKCERIHKIEQPKEDFLGRLGRTIRMPLLYWKERTNRKK